MLKKYKVVKIFMFLFIVTNLKNINICYANIEKNSDIEKTYEDIQDSIEYIRQNIKYIDSRVIEMKKTNAYDKYPAVRLNVETPVFGINSLIKSKLAIKENVSTTDIISGYSVYDIVRTNKVKVPSLSVGSVVVSTREINLKDENITMSDANQALKTILNAMQKSKTSKEFIDDYINKNFSEYIENDKKNNIKSLNNFANELEINLKSKENDLILLDVLDSSKYEEFLKEYNNIYNSIYSIKKQLNNILITEDNIKKSENNLNDIDLKIKKLNQDIEIEKESQEKDLEFVINRFLYKSQIELNDIKVFLGDSYDIVSIEDLKDNSIIRF